MGAASLRQLWAAPSLATLDIERLYVSHRAWLCGWLRRQTRSPERAADLAQDTFCKVMESSTEATLHSPRPYLATIARRLLIDDTRRRNVELVFLEAHAAVASGEAGPCPERIAAAIGELTAIVRELERLSERARRAFLLARLDEMSHAEIAAELGVSKSMVRQYVAKGLLCCYAAAHGAEFG
jgi:RNA polymerase sigma-19 factor, ECF subfamily